MPVAGALSLFCRGDLEAGELVLLAPLLEDLEEDMGAGAVDVVERGRRCLAAFLIVIARRAGIEERAARAAAVDDLLDPGVLGGLARLDHRRTFLEQLRDQIGEVHRPLAGEMGVIGGDAVLGKAEDEEVGEAAGLHAIERARAMAPALAQRLPAAPVYLEADLAGVFGEELEAGGVDDAVDRIF